MDQTEYLLNYQANKDMYFREAQKSSNPYWHYVSDVADTYSKINKDDLYNYYKSYFYRESATANNT